MSSPRGWLFCLAALVLAGPVRSQPATPAPPPPPGEEDRPRVRDSTVGYIDPAIPMSFLRLRYDTAYDNRTPTRAEYFYARTAPEGPGLPLPESSIDYRDVSFYLEYAFGERFSASANVPVRFVDLEVNGEQSGFADITLGLKYAFLYTDTTVASLQLLTHLPTGEARDGLGTDHVSLEPGVLVYQQLGDRAALEGELRYWTAVGGTEGFAGSLIRYGLGAHYNVVETCDWTVAPVVELVGWTFLSGQKIELLPSGLPVLGDADGDTVVNVKAGVRARLRDVADFYVGYGRALTGEVLYEDVFRVEFRLFY